MLESTTYPGTTEDLVLPLLESSGLRAGSDFLLAYSPERIDPGNTEFTLRTTPKIVGGATPEGTGVATLFYEQLCDKVVVVSSARAAELAKLLENAFRHVNIALVNEMAMLCRETGIDVWEVVEAAASKPFGYLPFYPGPGVGGHCIPLDSAYLAWQTRRDTGRQFRILELAEDVNGQMPAYVAMRIGEALNDVGKALKHARILVLGVTYKPDIGDLRESPALKVIAQLVRRGADVELPRSVRRADPCQRQRPRVLGADRATRVRGRLRRRHHTAPGVRPRVDRGSRGARLRCEKRVPGPPFRQRGAVVTELVLRQTPGVLWRSVGAEVILADRERTDFELLSGSGGAVWRALVEPRTFDDLVGSLAEGFEVDRGAIEDDVRRLVDNLSARGLVEAADV